MLLSLLLGNVYDDDDDNNDDDDKKRYHGIGLYELSFFFCELNYYHTVNKKDKMLAVNCIAL